MYELSILATLMEKVAHGYLIAQIINDIIGPYAKISFGRLYPLLAKLEQQGFISAYSTHEQSKRSQSGRRYQITEAGRKRFHDLMMDTRSHLGDYRLVFLQKVCVFDHLSSEERLFLIEHYMHYCQTHVLHMHAELNDLQRQEKQDRPAQLENVLVVMRHQALQWEAELAWAKNLQGREMP